ncbi:MAG: hypothetical protein Q8Q09_21695 [Deltaproteobacteria bacterium]|nr:hypothetical protein [Deltaproteobacteria bacterium]
MRSSPLRFVRKLALLGPLLGAPLLASCADAHAAPSCPRIQPRVSSRCAASIPDDMRCYYPGRSRFPTQCFCNHDTGRWACHTLYPPVGPLPPPSLDC